LHRFRFSFSMLISDCLLLVLLLFVRLAMSKRTSLFRTGISYFIRPRKHIFVLFI
jgi:hypothetical protein